MQTGAAEVEGKEKNIKAGIGQGNCAHGPVPGQPSSALLPKGQQARQAQGWRRALALRGVKSGCGQDSGRPTERAAHHATHIHMPAHTHKRMFMHAQRTRHPLCFQAKLGPLSGHAESVSIAPEHQARSLRPAHASTRTTAHTPFGYPLQPTPCAPTL